MDGSTYDSVSIFIVLLLIASGVSMATRWLRVPYALLLVIVGLFISLMHFLPSVHISPDLILLIFLPALLFEGAWNMNLKQLRKNLLPVLILAVVGVLLSAALAGLALRYMTGLNWKIALLFGAMIAPTDPVSVVTVFRKLGLPSRLTTIIEGESLSNDGMSVVVFRIVLGFVLADSLGPAGQIALNSARELLLVVSGGIAVGVVVGWTCSTLTSYFDDYLLEITLTTIAAYGSFLLAEAIHVSPVIAVLITGLIIGNYGRRIGMSTTTQVAVNSFWEYAGFVVTSLAFLLIGLEMNLGQILNHYREVSWGVAAMLLGRTVAVFGLMALTNRLGPKVPLRSQFVLFWGGLRGAVSLALVLSVPTSISERGLLVLMVFGSVLFSLLVQGLTLEAFIKKLKLSRKEQGSEEHDYLKGKILTQAAASTALESMRKKGIVTRPVYENLLERSEQSREDLNQKLTTIEEENPKLQAKSEKRVEDYLIGVKKARLAELFKRNVISEDVYRRLNAELDQEADSIKRKTSLT